MGFEGFKHLEFRGSCDKDPSLFRVAIDLLSKKLGDVLSNRSGIGATLLVRCSIAVSSSQELMRSLDAQAATEASLQLIADPGVPQMLQAHPWEVCCYSRGVPPASGGDGRSCCDTPWLGLGTASEGRLGIPLNPKTLNPKPKP